MSSSANHKSDHGNKLTNRVQTDVVRNRVEGLGIMGYFRIEPSKVETIEDILLLDLAKVLIPLG